MHERIKGAVVSPGAGALVLASPLQNVGVARRESLWASCLKGMQVPAARCGIVPED